MLSKVTISLLLSLSLVGCAGTGKYYWGGYESSLYSYYKDPTKADQLSSTLAEVIKTSEKKNKTVAPGLYAEYGFILLQQGKRSDAAAYFEKEKQAWPESTVIMESMIKVASKSYNSAQK
jgi:hypothetical protein